MNRPSIITFISTFLLITPTLVGQLPNVVWSKVWSEWGNNMRIKDAVVIDEQGSLLVVGQSWTQTDSIDHPTKLAIISPNGEMKQKKAIGRDGRFKGERAKMDRIGYYHNDRLLRLLPFENGNFLAIGFKTSGYYNRHLWIVEVDTNLQILRDSLYMNLPISDIGPYQVYPEKEGFRVVARRYWPEKELAHYSNVIYTFDQELNCIHQEDDLSFSSNGENFRMNWTYQMDRQEDKIYFCGHISPIGEGINEDRTKKISGLVCHDLKSKKTELIHRYDSLLTPTAVVVVENGKYIVGHRIKLPTLEKNKYPSNIEVTCYDKNHEVIWTSPIDMGVTEFVELITEHDGEIHVYGTAYNVLKRFFFEVILDENGQQLAKYTTDEAYDRDFVAEIPFNEEFAFRLMNDSGWRVEKFKIKE